MRVNLDELERVAVSEGADVVVAMVKELRLAREVVDQLPHPGLLNAAGNKNEYDPIRWQFYAASTALATYLTTYNQAAKP